MKNFTILLFTFFLFNGCYPNKVLRINTSNYKSKYPINLLKKNPTFKKYYKKGRNDTIRYILIEDTIDSKYLKLSYNKTYKNKKIRILLKQWHTIKEATIYAMLSTTDHAMRNMGATFENNASDFVYTDFYTIPITLNRHMYENFEGFINENVDIIPPLSINKKLQRLSFYNTNLKKYIEPIDGFRISIIKPDGTILKQSNKILTVEALKPYLRNPKYNPNLDILSKFKIAHEENNETYIEGEWQKEN